MPAHSAAARDALEREPRHRAPQSRLARRAFEQRLNLVPPALRDRVVRAGIEGCLVVGERALKVALLPADIAAPGQRLSRVPSPKLQARRHGSWARNIPTKP